MFRKHNQNLFITLEGGEGVGKSTVSSKLANRLSNLGFKVYKTSEPDSSDFGQAVKRLVMQTPDMGLSSEAMLFAAARHEHCKTISKWLNDDSADVPTIVICDRYILSSCVYQSGDACKNVDNVLRINSLADILIPDRNYVFDVSPDVSIARIQNRSNNNRFDRMSMAFHRQIYENYKLACCMSEKNGGFGSFFESALDIGDIKKVDALQSVDEITDEILEDIMDLLGRPSVDTGDRVEIISLGNEEPHYAPGDTGTVEFIDSANSIHVHWDNGGSIALLPECDKWRKL